MTEYVTEWYRLPDGDLKSRQYRCGRLLGRGNSSVYYEITLLQTQFTSACKIIRKAKLDDNARSELDKRIELQKNLIHNHICGLRHAFEDDNNIYILMELC